MKDVMLDLETMGTKPNSAIVAIGARLMDLGSLTLGNGFYRSVSLKSCMEHGLILDADTVMWWLQQSAEARAAIYTSTVSLEYALQEFSQWLADNKVAQREVTMWGNGSDFDNVLLANVYRTVGIAVPWEFRNNRCFRTAKAMLPKVDVQRTGTHHNALDDATHQAQVLLAALRLDRERIAPVKRVSKKRKV